jgi:hypothetical protein
MNPGYGRINIIYWRLIENTYILLENLAQPYKVSSAS